MSKKSRRKRELVEELHTDSEELQHSMNAKKWEYDFDVTNKYTFHGVQDEFLKFMQQDETHCAIVEGPAGSAKTYLAVLAALKLISKRKLDSLVYVRSVVESANKSIGSLPGEIDEKFSPWAIPLHDKLEELVSPATVQNLSMSGVIKCIPVNFLRGLTFRNSFVLVDEAQNLTLPELITILTRFGHNSKYVIAGDAFQADIGRQSGFTKIYNTFTTPDCEERGIKTFKFTESEIVRSEILKFIVQKLKQVS